MEWVKCSDKLPEESVPVLTYDPVIDELRVDYILLFEDGEEPYIWGRKLIDHWYHVTHWMPLPEPPKD